MSVENDDTDPKPRSSQTPRDRTVLHSKPVSRRASINIDVSTRSRSEARDTRSS
jgi:hypothetical protein